MKSVIGDATLHCGDAIEVLRMLPEASAQTCITSPPYWGLRDYGVEGQLGLERTPAEYVEKLVAVFREVRRVLRADGTLWLNLGDAYAANRSYQVTDNKHVDVGNNGAMRVPDGLKPKDLVGIPWRVAFALQACGWWLRSDIIWSKPNPMPESVTDRPTKAHEYLFLLAKAERYYYDAEAIAEASATYGRQNTSGLSPKSREKQALGHMSHSTGMADPYKYENRNRRSVWSIATQPYSGAHFATFPPKLIEPCVMAGAPSGGVVLDPFMGSGTTGEVALQNGRAFIGIELSPAYFGVLAVPRVQMAARQPRLIA